MKARMFSKDDIKDATIDPEYIGSPGIFDVGPIHWLAHKFGWNRFKMVLCWADEHTFVGSKCEDCEYLTPRALKVDKVYFQQRRTDWPDDLWPKAGEPEYLERLKQIPEDERRRMIMGDPTMDLPDYCVCRVPDRPLIDGVWCRECQGKVEEVTVKDLSNYAHGYVEQTPFEGRVIGRSDGGEPVMTWIQSVKTGKQYELYEWQFESLEA